MIIVIMISLSSATKTFPNAANQHPQSLHHQHQPIRARSTSVWYTTAAAVAAAKVINNSLRSTINNPQSTTRSNEATHEAAALSVRVISNAETMTHKSQRGKMKKK